MAKIEIKPLQGLKGITDNDINSWYEKMHSKFGSDFENVPEEEKAGMFLYHRFRDEFKDNNTVFTEIQELPRNNFEEAVKYWNAYQDYKEDPYTGYSVETPLGSRFDEKLPYDDKGVITPMSDIFKNRLSDEDKKAIENNPFGIQNIFDSKEYLKFNKDKLYDEKKFKEDPNYYYQVDNFAKDFKAKFDNSVRDTYNAFTTFDAIADGVSPIYKNFKNSEKLGLDANTTKHLMSYYYAISNLSGEQEANEFIREYMQNRLAERQGVGERYWEGFKGIGASAYGSAVSLAGGINAIITGEAFNSDDYNPELSNWSNFWNKVIDNDITRYGNDVIKYGTYNKNEIAKLKASGLDGSRIYQSVKAQQGTLSDMIFDDFWGGFVPTMMSQHGFTLTSSAISFGSTAALKGIAWLGKTAKNAAKAAKAAKTLDKAVDATQAVTEAVEKTSKVKDFLKGVAAVGNATLAGTSEAITNAIDTKDEFIRNGEADIENQYQKWFTEEMTKYVEQLDKDLLNQSTKNLKEGQAGLSKEDLEETRKLLIESYSKALEEQYAPIKERQLELLEQEAIQAQNTNFAFNQAINGGINATFKATVMHPSIKKHLGKWLEPDMFKIASDGKWYKTAWHYGRRMTGEMFGEGVEEYLTEGTDAISRGWHGADFEHYLENGYHTVGSEAVDASFGAALNGAMRAFGEAATSKEALYSFISGAFSSGISAGNITGIADTYNTFKDPNSTTADKAKAISSIFLRSSLFEGYQTARSELKAAKDQLESVATFASNPNNTATHTNAVTMATFLGEMNASTNSEVDYRNSKLGATVSEINLLEKSKTSNPGLYAKTMETLAQLQELDENSEFGKEQIEQYKHAGLAEVNETDAEIAAQIRKNAKEFSTLRTKVLTKRAANESKYGKNLDLDILDALTFGDITEEEYITRNKQMNSEIQESYTTGKETSEVSKRGNLNAEQKQHYIQHGDSKKSSDNISKLNQEVSIVEAKLAEAKKKASKYKGKDRKEAKKEVIKYTNELKTKKESLKSLEKSYNKARLEDTNIEEQYLSEDEILELSNKDRATVMSKEFYNKASTKQKAVIDNLKKILQKGDNILSSREDKPITGDSLTKIKDVGILDKSIKLHEELRAQGEEAISNYGRTIKRNALQRKSEERIKAIGEIQDYKKFEEALVPLLENPKTSSTDRINAEILLKDNENYKRLKAKRHNIQLIFDKISQFLKKNNNLFTRAEAEALYVMGGYLAKNEIDLSNINEIERVLTPENLDTYYKELKGAEANPNVVFSLELIRDFINSIKDANAQVEQVEQIKKPIETAPASPLKNLPLTPEVPPTVQATEEDKKAALELANSEVKDIKKGIKEVIKSVVDRCIKANLDLQSAKVLNPLIAVASFKGHQNENIALAILLAKANNNFDEAKTEDVKRILEVNGITASDDDIEMTKLLIEDANIKVSNDNKVTVNYEDVTDKVNELVTPLLEKKSNQTTQEQQPSTTSMIIPIDSDDPQIQAAAERHNIKKYLEERNYSKERQKDVMAVVASDIPGLITDNSCPIYLIVKNTEGTIKINGVKYQVIGILPPNANIEGSDIASKLQKMAIEQGLHKQGGYTTIKKLEKSGSGYSTVAVTFDGYTSENKTPTHRDKSKKNVSIREEIAGGKKTIKELLQRIVKVTRKISDGKATMVYTSPFTGKEVEYTRDAKEGEKDWTYTAYINHDGKGNEKEIELFVSDLNDYDLPIGRNFIEFLLDSKISLEDKFKTLINPKNSGYFISKYTSTLQSGVEGIIKALDSSSPAVVNGEISLDQETSLKIEFLTGTLHNSLNRFVHSKKASLEVFPTLEDDKGNIAYVIAYEVDGEVINTPITLGTFSKVGAVVRFNKPTIEEINIAKFVIEALTENGKIRTVGNDPIFKIQVDYDKVDAAKRTFDLEAKKESGEELTSEEWKEYYALQDVISLVQSDAITHSKEEGLDRQGWEIKITKSVDSFQSGAKQSSQKTTPEGVLTSEGLKDPTSGMELDETLTTTPVVNQGVKEALDQLVEAKKARDERKAKRVQDDSNLQVESATNRNYSYSEEIDPVTATVGNIYDSAVRDLINGDIKTVKELTKKYPNLRQEEATNLFNDVKTLIEAATNDGWTLDAREMYLSTTLPGKNTDGEVEFHGIPDIVGYNATGEIIIIDVKTFAPGKDINGTIESWSGQTSDYGNALTKLTGYPIKAVYVFAREVTYNSDTDVLGGKLVEGAATSSITSKSRVVGDKLMYELNYQKIDTNPEPIETSIDEIINGDDLGIDSSDLGDIFDMVWDEHFKSEEEKQKEACSN